jgi:hypothetical protein
MMPRGSKLMSNFSERDSIDPDDPRLDYAPLSLSERAAKLGPSVSQAARLEPRSPPLSRPASLVAEVIKEPARPTRGVDRAALLSVAARVTAVAAMVAVVALLFVIMKPASRQSVASSTPSDITGSTPPSNRRDIELEPKPPPPELSAPFSQTATQDPSQQLLGRFLQWRENATTTESPR